MMSVSFVSFILIISSLSSSMLAASPWSNSFFLEPPVPVAPPEPPDTYDDPKQFLPKLSKLSLGQRPLWLGLLAAIAMADSIPDVDLIQDKTFKCKLRSHRGSHGFLMMANLKDATIKQLRVILEASKAHLLRNDDCFELMMDVGCSKTCTPCLSNFVPGSLTDLNEPMCMDGIAGALTALKKGRVQCKVINDAGGLPVLSCEACCLPALKFRLSVHKPSSMNPLSAMESAHSSGMDPFSNWPTVTRFMSDTIVRLLSPCFVPSLVP
jgi:hypothetical protein